VAWVRARSARLVTIRAQEWPAPGATAAAELGDRFAVFSGDRDVVQAEAARSAEGDELVPQAAGGDQHDVEAGGDGDLVIGVAGECGGAVGQGRDAPAAAVALLVHHGFADAHRQDGATGSDRRWSQSADGDGQALDDRCAAAMWERDQASQRLGMKTGTMRFVISVDLPLRAEPVGDR